MTPPLIVSAVRTAIGTSFKGSLASTSAHQLARTVVSAAVARSGADPGAIDDVILAESLAGGGVLARYAAVEAGMPTVSGLALNRHCAGGLTAIGVAASAIRAGAEHLLVAGGVQSTSTAPALRDPFALETPWFSDPHPPQADAPPQDVSISVGWNTAVEAGLTREAMDGWALRSHQRAIAAIDGGRFRDEIVPLELTAEDGVRLFDVDEHPRRDTTPEKLARLRVLHPEIDGFSVTAGNASGVNDAAAAVVVASADAARAHGLSGMAAIRSWASVGIDPARTGLAPVGAIRKALDRAGLKVSDIDLWEINEAFASVPMAVGAELGLDETVVNPYGSGCSLGHPIAATGARMVTTLAHEIGRGGARTAVAAMCAGGGMGYAVVLEALG